jgi:uncharacterized coiled-coil protein SlyX
MLGFINKWIEDQLLKYLHKRRDKILTKTLADFAAHHNTDDATMSALRAYLEFQMNRTFAITDRSIIRARLKQAMLTFWLTALFSTALTVGLAAYPPTLSIAVFFVPLITSVIAWAVQIATIPYNYNERVQGGMDAAVIEFENQLIHPPAPNLTNQVQTLTSTDKLQMEHIQQLTQQLAEVQARVAQQSQQINAFMDKMTNSAPPSITEVKGATLWQSAIKTETSDKEIEHASQIPAP